MTLNRRTLIGALATLTIGSRVAQAQTASSAAAIPSATGYRVEFDEFTASGPLVLVLMHGKNGSPRTPLMQEFARRLAAGGVTVYLPSMPWSRAWNGTVADANAAIDALVARAAAAGRKAVVGGLSLGATFAMTWRPADPPPAVVAKAFLNPGGLLDLIPPASPFWSRVAPELERAKALEAAGQGKVPVQIAGSNAVGEALVGETYTMTPEVYLSFHDPARFPSVRSALAATRLPVFWTSGTRDPTTNAKRRTFETMPRHPLSVYSEPDGDHNTAFVPAAGPFAAWLAANFTK